VYTVVAMRKKQSDTYSASKLRLISLRVSVYGTLATVAVGLLVPPWLSFAFDTNCKHYSYSGSCYDYRIYVGTSGSCSNGV